MVSIDAVGVLAFGRDGDVFQIDLDGARPAMGASDSRKLPLP